MGEVVDLAAVREEREPHLVGRARCAACKHEWEAVSPIGVVGGLECPNPECGAFRGFRLFPTLRDDPLWTCNCGCDLFHATQQGLYCPNCATWQKGF